MQYTFNTLTRPKIKNDPVKAGNDLVNDPVKIAILLHLKQDPKATYAEIAEKTGYPPLLVFFTNSSKASSRPIIFRKIILKAETCGLAAVRELRVTTPATATKTATKIIHHW